VKKKGRGAAPGDTGAETSCESTADAGGDGKASAPPEVAALEEVAASAEAVAEAGADANAGAEADAGAPWDVVEAEVEASDGAPAGASLAACGAQDSESDAAARKARLTPRAA